VCVGGVGLFFLGVKIYGDELLLGVIKTTECYSQVAYVAEMIHET